MKRKNPVAKHCRTFNKAVVHKDQKQETKRGKEKHRQSWLKEERTDRE